MTDPKNTHPKSCQKFLENLDIWLADELANDLKAQQQEFMQAHVDVCPDCALEMRLATNIDAITQSLPALEHPEQQIAAKGIRRARTAQDAKGFFAQFVTAWRQPLVFGPALAMILAAGIFIHIQQTNPAIEQDVIVVNGQEYTPEEVIRAAEELEIALQYLNKYSNYAVRAVRHELRDSDSSMSSPEDVSNDPSI